MSKGKITIVVVSAILIAGGIFYYINSNIKTDR